MNIFETYYKEILTEGQVPQQATFDLATTQEANKAISQVIHLKQLSKVDFVHGNLKLKILH